MRVRLLAGLTVVTCAAALWLSAPVLAQGQAEPDPEGQALVQYVQDVMGGVNVPPDVMLEWEPFIVKSEGDTIYVPFSVAIPEDALEDEVTMYYAVVPKGPRVTMFSANPTDDENVVIAGEMVNTSSTTAQNVMATVTLLDEEGLSLGVQEVNVPEVPPGQTTPFSATVTQPEGTQQYSVVVAGSLPVFRDLSVQDLPNAGSDDLIRLNRAFVAPNGEYEFILVLREREARDAGTPRRLALLHQDVVVPDLTEGLAVSSVFVARRIDVLPKPLDNDDQMDAPFTLGNMVIDPMFGGGAPEIPRNGELSIIFFIYNAAFDDNKKPSVEVQYDFHIKTNEGEEYFNRTNPQQFNAETLPAEFDLTAGHQIVGGQSVPVGSFEPGEYRLELTINDTLSGESLTENVPFVVAGS